jgi:hypothetical protein
MQIHPNFTGTLFSVMTNVGKDMDLRRTQSFAFGLGSLKLTPHNLKVMILSVPRSFLKAIGIKDFEAAPNKVNFNKSLEGIKTSEYKISHICKKG